MVIVKKSHDEDVPTTEKTIASTQAQDCTSSVGGGGRSGSRGRGGTSSAGGGVTPPKKQATPAPRGGVGKMQKSVTVGTSSTPTTTSTTGSGSSSVPNSNNNPNKNISNPKRHNKSKKLIVTTNDREEKSSQQLRRSTESEVEGRQADPKNGSSERGGGGVPSSRDTKNKEISRSWSSTSRTSKRGKSRTAGSGEVPPGSPSKEGWSSSSPSKKKNSKLKSSSGRTSNGNDNMGDNSSKPSSPPPSSSTVVKDADGAKGVVGASTTLTSKPDASADSSPCPKQEYKKNTDRKRGKKPSADDEASNPPTSQGTEDSQRTGDAKVEEKQASVASPRAENPGKNEEVAEQRKVATTSSPKRGIPRGKKQGKKVNEVRRHPSPPSAGKTQVNDKKKEESQQVKDSSPADTPVDASPVVQAVAPSEDQQTTSKKNHRFGGKKGRHAKNIKSKIAGGESEDAKVEDLVVETKRDVSGRENAQAPVETPDTKRDNSKSTKQRGSRGHRRKPFNQSRSSPRYDLEERLLVSPITVGSNASASIASSDHPNTFEATLFRSPFAQDYPEGNAGMGTVHEGVVRGMNTSLYSFPSLLVAGEDHKSQGGDSSTRSPVPAQVYTNEAGAAILRSISGGGGFEQGGANSSASFASSSVSSSVPVSPSLLPSTNPPMYHYATSNVYQANNNVHFPLPPTGGGDVPPMLPPGAAFYPPGIGGMPVPTAAFGWEYSLHPAVLEQLQQQFHAAGYWNGGGNVPPFMPPPPSYVDDGYSTTCPPHPRAVQSTSYHPMGDHHHMRKHLNADAKAFEPKRKDI